MTGRDLPRLRTAVPGPRSRRLARELRRVESRNVTYVTHRWPIFWERARGANVVDVDGNRFLDLTAAFGVSGVGHTNARVAAAVREQSRKLLHGMGDVHPHEPKVRLARELVRLTFGRWETGRSPRREEGETGQAGSAGPLLTSGATMSAKAKVIFSNSGFESVEAALKTAVLSTGKRGVIAFEGAYHGLGYGALDATWPREFREKFEKQLGHFTVHLPYGRVPDRLPGRDIGAVIVEPIQGRAGVVIPPDEFLPGLRRFCDRHDLLLILDEIFTGFGRTGKWFACEHWNVVPDLICVGKGMTGGFPISACIGRADVMDAWPESTGEAIHTSTFLGNPLGCAMSLAAIEEIRARNLVERASRLGKFMLDRLSTLNSQLSTLSLRGSGLMIGIEYARAADCARIVEQLLQRGVIVLSGGTAHNVLTLTPPFVITERQLRYFVAQMGS